MGPSTSPQSGPSHPAHPRLGFRRRRGGRAPRGSAQYPLPAGAGQELPGESQAGRGRRSPRLPKVRRPAPRARSPWSRCPARAPRRSRAAGLRRGRPVFSPPPRPACARPAGGAAGRRQVREPERAPGPLPAPLPPGRLRGRAGWRSRESAEQRAAARSPPGFPSPFARPPLSAPLEACSRISGTRLARPSLAPCGPSSLRPVLRLLPPGAPRGPSPPRRGGHTRPPSQSQAGLGGGPPGGRVLPPRPPHPQASPAALLGLTRPRGGSARRGGEEGCGCGLGLPS